MEEAFKTDPELLAKYKCSTVKGLKETWRHNIFSAHRRKWCDMLENDGASARQWPFYASLEFIRLQMVEPWPERLLKCKKCSYTTNRGDQMTQHKRTRHMTREKRTKLICPECGFQAQNYTYLEDHRNVVHLNNKKRHKCDQCDYTCGYYNSLHNHQKIHKPDHLGKKFMCDHCSHKFRCPAKMREHVDAVHLKMKPYKCGIGDCTWTTGYRANIGVHRRKVHGLTSRKTGHPGKVKLEESKEVSEDEDNGEKQKIEIRKALIEEVKRHPMIWHPLHKRPGGKNNYSKGNWVDIWNNLERRFPNDIYFLELFPLEDSKERSMSKVKAKWHSLQQRYKQQAHDANWPYRDSLKFLDDGVAIPEPSPDKASEPQIFKEVRKYVQRGLNQGQPKIFKDVSKYVQQRINQGGESGIMMGSEVFCYAGLKRETEAYM